MYESAFMKADHKMLNGTIFTLGNATFVTQKPGLCGFESEELSEKSARNWHFSAHLRQIGPIGTTNQ